MNGRPLNDEEISRIERFGWVIGDIPNLIATIRDRDKSLTDADKTLTQMEQRMFEGAYETSKEHERLVQQNTLMLSALEVIRANEFSTWTLGGFIRDTITQVKALNAK